MVLKDYFLAQLDREAAPPAKPSSAYPKDTTASSPTRVQWNSAISPPLSPACSAGSPS